VRRNGCVSVSGNCHRFAAKEFRKTIVKFPAKYRLGVTATPERRDGMEDVFFWHIGEIAAKGSKRKIKPRVVMVDTKIPVTRTQKRTLAKNGSIGWSTMITYLTERDDRNRKLAKELFKALKAGRKILALSDRRDHLRELARLVKIMMKKYDERFTIGFYVGGTDKMERTIAAGRDLVFGTYQMAEEGLDIPALDTLFLMTPRSAVEQAVGRILRQHDSKKEPLVVDFVDTAFYLAQGVARKREQQYKELGYMK
jgi:superfamily II DNA or RNA helicase